MLGRRSGLGVVCDPLVVCFGEIDGVRKKTASQRCEKENICKTDWVLQRRTTGGQRVCRGAQTEFGNKICSDTIRIYKLRLSKYEYS